MNFTNTTPKPHTDGGTFQTLALANTANGFAIAITKRIFRGKVSFDVNRVTPSNYLFRISRHATEAAARAAGNRAWADERMVAA